MFRLTPLLLVALVCGLAGCGSAGPERFDVSGSVTFAGQPVSQGVVYFDPDVAHGQDGVQGYAEIENGRFSTEATGKGLGGGKYVVRIRGFGSARPGVMPPPLFQEYQTTAELQQPSTSLSFEVPQSAATASRSPPVDTPIP